jgi:hypothetical protein
VEVSRVPWWGWLALGLAGGIVLVGLPVALHLRRFLRDLDRVTGWGGWGRKQ